MEKELLEQRKNMLTELVNDRAYVPMKAKELAILLNLSREQRPQLQEVLDALVAEGRLGVSKKGKYGKPETFSLTGSFTGNARGFGFVTVEGMAQDIFIPEEKTGAAMNGDRVQIVVEQEGGGGKRACGQVLRVLEHANREIVGFYQKNKSYGFVIPDSPRLSKDIFIPQGMDLGAVTGHKVVVTVTEFGDGRRKPEGRITEILGHAGDPGTDILSVVRACGLPEQFPQEVMREAEAVPESLPEEELREALAVREDLRGLMTVTIDGEDAKDLDDAVTLSRDEKGHYHLGVHIADVSHYVKEGSALDQEALRRGTSVYLVDRVIPMLPHRLSNGICSLNAGEDRLALSCLMELDASGCLVGHRICESLVRVDRRMTYTAVNQILSGEEEELRKEYEAFVPLLCQMAELSELLRERRQKRGALDFDFPESRIVLDERGKAVEIRPYERSAATKLIEDFMLLANETVAEDYFWQSLPFLYRTHDNPDPERMKQLGVFLENFGYFVRMQQGEVHPKELQKLLNRIEGTAEEPLLSRLVLRSMKQAKYTTICSGHFGLAARYYTHFTSPIRRYPDLQIHRIIKENLHGGLNGSRIAHYEELLPQVALQSSTTERRAEEAERETVKMKKCEYMSHRIGEEFDGVISGVAAWGFYVELPNTVEGLVRLDDMIDDYYIFDEKKYELRGEMTRRSFRLGQPVRVQVTGTDRLLRSVNFILAHHWEQEQEGKE